MGVKSAVLCHDGQHQEMKGVHKITSFCYFLCNIYDKDNM